tara:strand:+ start:1278 stop:4412 length:3135 start_codon:yes stop_codon:yes gene_type:complete
MKILHIADVHWRGLSRHEEFILSFKDLFKQAKKLKPDVIYIGGDIVHSKTQGISPELVENLAWWFNEMASIAPTHVILGNHDGLIHNKDRQDAITPIINAINNDNIYLYKDSGVYPTGIPGFDWCVFSCFDEENWSKVKPTKNISIALFHGAVTGSLTDIDWQLDGEVPVNFFDAFDFGLLGDIHKTQFLNREKTVAYCGSTIQQNYGEDQEKGFLLWDIRSRKDFDVTFYPVKNDYKFVTVDWRGDIEKTVKACMPFSRQSRFRIRAENDYITPAQTRSLQKALKKLKNASEVVFKIDNSFTSEKIKEGEATSVNLRDPKVMKDLVRQYYAGAGIKESEWKQLDEMTNRHLSEVTQENSDLRNVKWGVSKIKFDNTFCYGEDNVINLDKLQGITGIFGKNAKGKSSIVGTIAYGLFNSSDRGSIKNIHIINSRKSNCKTEVDIVVNGSLFRIVRETSKKITKNNVWAPTTLNVYRINASGEILEDLTEEQRRESEKILRSMIGSPEEFHMTSLASQGEMNTFIKEKATSRKNILSNFLDMSVFESMNDLAKKETSNLRAELKQYTPTQGGWAQAINALKETKKDRQDSLDVVNVEKNEIQSEIEKLTKELHQDSKEEFVSISEVEKSVLERDNLKSNAAGVQLSLDDMSDEIFESEQKISKIENFITSFDIEDMKEKHSASKVLVKTLWEIEGHFKAESAELANMEKSVKKLLEVPCGDSFPECKFIKDSHRDKRKIEEKRLKVNKLQTNVLDLKESYKKIQKENYEEKIEKYNAIVEKKSRLISDISSNRVQIQVLQNKISNLEKEFLKSANLCKELQLRFDSQNKEDDKSGISKILDFKKEEFRKNDAKRVTLIKSVEATRLSLTQAVTQKNRYDELTIQLKVQDLFMQATSNRGMPIQIINSLLPKINSEISKILKGVVPFTVLLEAELESNAMNVFIDYGDSKRIIELASGMEKMISSLAIRVALINISSLPKTSMLIIDEGFGTLDETNLESCGRLLQSLKKWFKNIIIISHIDAIKDIVDHTIEITKSGPDSYVKSI